MRRSAAVAFLLLAFALAGCGTLRQWVAPFRGVNSDTWYNEPTSGQYRQPDDRELNR